MSEVHAGGSLGGFRSAERATGRPAIRTRLGLWPHLFLFLLTFVTTTAFGFGLQNSFEAGRSFELGSVLEGYGQLVRFNSQFFRGMYFSVPLLLILLAHEFGHYVACRYWSVDASLPFFLPSPTLLGTLGAFIRIRSPILTRAMLLDIGVAGPIAGFVALLPFLLIGIVWSRTSGSQPPDVIALGTPLLMQVTELVHFGTHPSGYIVLHPFAVAAWAGLLATAVNLMPLGQLDGGHIIYAALGARWHRWISILFIGVLAVLGFLYWAWWVWAVVMFFFGRRHPLVYDETRLSGKRLSLSVLSIVLFIASASVVPVSTL